MPQIIVTAGAGDDLRKGTVLLRERVNATDFESDRFTTNLLERLGWAVEDATAAEQRESVIEPRAPGSRLPRIAEPQPEQDLEPIGVA